MKNRHWWGTLLTGWWLLQLPMPVMAAAVEPTESSPETTIQQANSNQASQQSPSVINQTSLERYLTASQQGFSDGFTKQPSNPPTDEPFRTGYLQGYQRGEQMAARVHSQPSVPADSSSARTSQPITAPAVDHSANEFDHADPPATLSTTEDTDDPAENEADDEASVLTTPNVPLKADEQAYSLMTPTLTQRQFIERLGPLARKVSQKHDLYASVMIAQAALESNWGQSQLSQAHHNLFGIKGTWHGQGVSMMTNECLHGQNTLVGGMFKSYDSWRDSLTDYAIILDQPFYAGVHRGRTNSYRQATRYLTGRYATDPRYDRKLNQLIDAYQLTRFDQSLPSHHRQRVRHEVKAAKAALPVTTVKKYHHHDQTTRPADQHWLSIVGGIGSVGLLEALRRWHH